MLYIYSDTLVVNCSCCCSFLFFIFIAHWHRAPAPFPQTSSVGVCAYPVTSSPFLLLLHVTQHAAPSPFSFSSKKKKGGGVWPADEKVFLFCFFFRFLACWPSETKSDVKNGTDSRNAKLVLLFLFCFHLMCHHRATMTTHSSRNCVIVFGRMCRYTLRVTKIAGERKKKIKKIRKKKTFFFFSPLLLLISIEIKSFE